MDLMLLMKIATEGGLERPVQLSSSRLGGLLGMSQQTASRKLKRLEDDGLISREILPRGQTVRITSKGKQFIGGIYHDLSAVYGGIEAASISICGSITTGMGEGEYYMGMSEYADQFENKLGFRPYPGTLNLKLKSSEDIKNRQKLNDLPGIAINGFKRENRSFGDVKCFKSDIDGVKGAVVIPARTHHSTDTIEAIAKVRIRETLDMKEGDKVCLRLRI